MLTRRAFHRWLMAHASHDLVGYAAVPTSCPLARFLQSEGVQDACVDQQVYWRTHHKRPLPRWAQAFVARLDRQSRLCCNPVTVKEALAALTAEESHP